jgi:hypothetical protein
MGAMVLTSTGARKWRSQLSPHSEGNCELGRDRLPAIGSTETEKGLSDGIVVPADGPKTGHMVRLSAHRSAGVAEGLRKGAGSEVAAGLPERVEGAGLGDRGDPGGFGGGRREGALADHDVKRAAGGGAGRGDLADDLPFQALRVDPSLTADRRVGDREAPLEDEQV